MAFPVTINGNTYTASMFTPYGYVTGFPAILSDLAAVASAISSAASGIVVGTLEVSGANATSSIYDSSTYAIGVGGVENYDFKNASGTRRTGGRVETQATTGTNGAEVADLVFWTMRSGTLTAVWKILGSGALVPVVDDGAALGSTTLRISDAFFALGAVINFNNGNATITHSAGALDIAASSLTFNGNAIQTPPPPCGRLTLTTGTPVSPTDVAGATTVYYTPCSGHRFVPLWDSSLSKFYPFDIGGELSQLTTDTTKSPAAVANNSSYDLFAWSDSGTARTTRGPAWSSDTARGTGAGTTELELLNGVYVNKNAITNGPAARKGTYVGTIRSNGSATIDWKLGTKAASGGEARLCVWNAYNRKNVVAKVGDTTDSWTLASSAIRAANNSSTMRVSFVSGLQEDFFDSSYAGGAQAGSGGQIALGVGLNSTTAFAFGGSGFGTSTSFVTSRGEYADCLLGFNYIQAIEASQAGGTATFTGDGGAATYAQNLLKFALMM